MPLFVEMIIGLLDPKTMQNFEYSISDLLRIPLPHAYTCKSKLDETSSFDHLISFVLLSEVTIFSSYRASQLSDRIAKLTGTCVVASLPIQLSESRKPQP